MEGQAGRHRQDDHPAGGSGVRAWPARSFAPNPAAYDPHYHYQLAIDAGLSPMPPRWAMLEAGADTFAGQIPTILKVNSANSLMSGTAARTRRSPPRSTTRCGWAVRPSDSRSIRGRHGARHVRGDREMRAEAAACGIATVIWSYPRGEALSRTARRRST
jgi:fructose-bisphosphate aldolase, class I